MPQSQDYWHMYHLYKCHKGAMFDPQNTEWECTGGCMSHKFWGWLHS